MSKIKKHIKNKKIEKVYDWLELHPLFKSQFNKNLHIEYVLVNPKTNRISNKKKKNTKVRVWLEVSYPHFEHDESFLGTEARFISTIDAKLNSGGDTFEEAIIKLAKQVYKHYGDYTMEAYELAELYYMYNGDFDLALHKRHQFNKRAKKMVKILNKKFKSKDNTEDTVKKTDEDENK